MYARVYFYVNGLNHYVNNTEVMKFLKTIEKKVFTRNVALHICCWLTFILYELGFLYYSYGKLQPVTDYLMYYGLNILFFYSHARLMRYVFDRPSPKYFTGLLLYLDLIITYLVLKFNLGFLSKTPHLTYSSSFADFQRFLSTVLFRAGYFTLLATFYWAARHISYYREQAAASERKQLLAQKDKAELEIRLAISHNAYLKQQLNPHLLFNTLNFIYSSVFEQSPTAAKCVVLLSDIIRISLEETGEDGKVPLEEEAAQLQRLVCINQFRFDDPPSISVELDGPLGGYRIIPLILFTLTENLFKHGNLLNRAFPALLRLKVDDQGTLYFYTRNLKKSKSEYSRRSQIGLHNVRVRLDFAYPGQYELLIAETEECYELTLNLQL